MTKFDYTKLLDTDREAVKLAIEQIDDEIGLDPEQKKHLNDRVIHEVKKRALKPRGQIYGGRITVPETAGVIHLDFVYPTIHNSQNSELYTSNLRFPFQQVWNLEVKNRGFGEIGIALNTGRGGDVEGTRYIILPGDSLDTSSKYILDEPIFNDINIACLSGTEATVVLSLFV